MPRSEGGSTTDQPMTEQQTETERVMEQRRGERGGQDTSSMRTYTVKSGDSLSAIAQSEMGDAKRWPELYEANKDAVGKNPDLIHPGLGAQDPRLTRSAALWLRRSAYFFRPGFTFERISFLAAAAITATGRVRSTATA